VSPEQLISAEHVDHRTDVWAPAVVAYEALTGRRPFEGVPMLVASRRSAPHHVYPFAVRLQGAHGEPLLPGLRRAQIEHPLRRRRALRRSAPTDRTRALRSMVAA
jgi:serine/threonine protein kinase